MYNFQKAHHIVSRKITKFVTRKTLEDDEKLKKIAPKFVQAVKPFVKEYLHIYIANIHVEITYIKY